MPAPLKPLPRISILGLALFATTACGSSSPAAPDGPLTYDLAIELTQIYVVGDCETAAGNPGEFAWRARASVDVRQGATDVHETSGFPSEAGAETYSEDDSPVPLTGVTLLLTPIAEADVARTSLTFSVIEWDQGSHDPEMQFRQVSVAVPFSLGSGINAVDVGDTNACKLSFEFRRTWTVS